MEQLVGLEVGDSRIDFLTLEDGDERESVFDDLRDENAVNVEGSISRERRSVEVNSRRNRGSETIERRGGSREDVAVRRGRGGRTRDAIRTRLD